VRDYSDYHGHTKGAEQAWKKYLEANPIFDRRSDKKNPQPNPNRLDYKTYYSQQNKQNGISVSGNGFENVSDDELLGMLK